MTDHDHDFNLYCYVHCCWAESLLNTNIFITVDGSCSTDAIAVPSVGTNVFHVYCSLFCVLSPNVFVLGELSLYLV